METAASSGAEGPGSGRREALLLVVASAALVTFLYLLPPAIFDSEDYIKLHAINRAYLVRSVLSGRLPLWNPHVGLGRPFLADIETATFYPPNLLYLVLEPHLCLVLLLVAHTALLLAGWLRLGRHLGVDAAPAWLGGLGFVASGAVVGTLHKGLVPYGDAIAWTPLVFFLGARLQDRWSARDAANLALGLGLQVLCGHPQMAWLTWFGLGLFLAARGIGVPGGWRPLAAGLGGLTLALVGGLALAAVHLLPFVELVGQGNRSAPTVRFASSGALGWLQWASLFVPAGAGPPIVFGASFYVGALLTIAALAGLTRLGDRNVRALAVVAAVGILYSVGESTPVFGLLYRFVPGLSSFRFPGRMGVIVTPVLLLAAGLFLSERATRRAGVAACAVGGLLAAWVILRWQPALPTSGAPGSRVLHAVLAAAGAALLLWWHRRASPSRPGAGLLGAVAAVALAEIASTSLAHAPFRVGGGPFPGERAVAGALQGAGLIRAGAPPPRVLVPYPVIRDDSGMLYGFSSPSGYVALTLGSVWIYLHESLGLAAPVEVNTFPSPEIFDFGPFPYRHASLVLGYDRAASRLVRNPDPDPRAWVAHAVEVVADVHEAVARLRAGQDRDHATLLAPSQGFAAASTSASQARAEIVAFAPERVEVDVDTDQPGLLVVGEAWYPGWRATVNGREAPCLQANGWMRAVAVPAGRSRVVLSYRSRYLPLGLALSLGSLALCLAARRVSAGRPRSRP